MIIESLQNARVKRLVALQQKRRERTKHQLFVVEGEREVSRALTCEYNLVELWISQAQSLNVDLEPAKMTICTPQVFSKVSYRDEASKCLGVFKMKQHVLKDLKLPKNPFIIGLENVEKPGNLGAVLRSANAFGADAVFVCDSSVDFYNPNVIRNSLGSFFDLPIITCTSQEAISYLKNEGIQIITTHLEAAKNYLEVDYQKPSAIILGTESTGLTDLWVKNTSSNVVIKMRGIVDSLNISVAAGIVMSEVARQRA